jgi:hypothetical protein
MRKPISVLYKYEGWGRGATDAYMPPRETLAVASSQSNSKALAAHVVLAHPHVTFYPCTCRLRRGAATVVTVLIGYDDVNVAIETTTRRRRS